MNADQLEQALSAQAGPKAQKQAAGIDGDRKNNVLSQILDQSARARLNNIGSADPAKMQQIEAFLIQMAQKGQLRGKMNEEALKDVLSQMAEQSQNETKVVYKRRTVFDSDEEDEDDDWWSREKWIHWKLIFSKL